MDPVVLAGGRVPVRYQMLADRRSRSVLLRGLQQWGDVGDVLVEARQFPTRVRISWPRVGDDQPGPVRRTMDLRHPRLGPHRQLPSGDRAGLVLLSPNHLHERLRWWVGGGPQPSERELASSVHVLEPAEQRRKGSDPRITVGEPLLGAVVERGVQLTTESFDDRLGDRCSPTQTAGRRRRS